MRRAIEDHPWIRIVHPAMTFAALGIGFTAGWLIGEVVKSMLPQNLAGWPRLIMILAPAIPVVAMTWGAFALVNRALLGRHMRTAMRELGYVVCPECGYWLRGLPETTDTCPECGSKPGETT